MITVGRLPIITLMAITLTVSSACAVSPPQISARYNAVGNFSRITEVATRIANQLPQEGNSAAFKIAASCWPRSWAI